MIIELTKGQCISLANFIELSLLDYIRKDEEVDSLEWVRNILNALQTFEEAAKSEEP